MPELPEVQTVLNGLSETLKGRSLSALVCHYEGTVIIDPEITRSPFPARFIGFHRRGKYILLDLENDTTLIVHLRMTGKLIFVRRDKERTCGDEASEEGSFDLSSELKHIRATITLDKRGLVLFNDPRTFGKIWLCRTENTDKYLPVLGPEPLDDSFDAAYLGKKVKNRKAPVKNVLLDQKVVAGLGNIYVSEILFRAGVSPERPANALSAKEIRQIVKETRQVLSEAIALNGTSISDFRRIDDKTGEFQNYLRVYQRSHCPQGHPVIRIRQAGRSSFYCPRCQH